ncbi:SURF1 family protein [Undibacterium oligocarboniphilum]|uniref:SURF1-like protein n=1 Tax=Undibacterium oligocarboniphilum TaxID=666702 RepID=A0A850QC89_9BURK|nr:SURF1 family protein [Undibacterium oligocarboniphilum]MBC3868899.1 SURF1 family protein [Undibacterium oligocarboniphilum]NVO76879.1 SURF1 family protein [Undibacterium oligocarboniphilum]
MTDGADVVRADASASAGAPEQPRSAIVTWIVTICAGLFFFSFTALGCWQLWRLQWKLDLISRVEQRVHTAAVMPPAQAAWPAVSAASDEYRHVRLQGCFLFRQTVYVKAATELGGGFWMLVPLQQEDGSVVLVNRGFVKQKKDADVRTPQSGSVRYTVTGLLRMSEPGGGFLRNNDPRHGNWFSRDIGAIAQAQQISRVAPFFVDADAAAQQPDATYRALLAGEDPAPAGGLTVISFHNNHLVYALTWYALALMVAGGYYLVFRERCRQLRSSVAKQDGTQGECQHDRQGRKS